MSLRISQYLDGIITYVISKVWYNLTYRAYKISQNQSPVVRSPIIYLYFLNIGHSVVVVNEDGQFLRRIGSEKVTCFPNGIDISDAGDVLIGDSHGNQFHVAVYDKDAQLVSQFVCPNVKVSR